MHVYQALHNKDTLHAYKPLHDKGTLHAYTALHDKGTLHAYTALHDKDTLQSGRLTLIVLVVATKEGDPLCSPVLYASGTFPVQINSVK